MVLDLDDGPPTPKRAPGFDPAEDGSRVVHVTVVDAEGLPPARRGVHFTVSSHTCHTPVFARGRGGGPAAADLARDPEALARAAHASMPLLQHRSKFRCDLSASSGAATVAAAPAAPMGAGSPGGVGAGPGSAPSSSPSKSLGRSIAPHEKSVVRVPAGQELLSVTIELWCDRFVQHGAIQAATARRRAVADRLSAARRALGKEPPLGTPARAHGGHSAARDSLGAATDEGEAAAAAAGGGAPPGERGLSGAGTPEPASAPKKTGRLSMLRQKFRRGRGSNASSSTGRGSDASDAMPAPDAAPPGTPCQRAATTAGADGASEVTSTPGRPPVPLTAEAEATLNREEASLSAQLHQCDAEIHALTRAGSESNFVQYHYRHQTEYALEQSAELIGVAEVPVTSLEERITTHEWVPLLFPGSLAPRGMVHLMLRNVPAARRRVSSAEQGIFLPPPRPPPALTLGPAAAVPLSPLAGGGADAGNGEGGSGEEGSSGEEGGPRDRRGGASRGGASETVVDREQAARTLRAKLHALAAGYKKLQSELEDTLREVRDLDEECDGVVAETAAVEKEQEEVEAQIAETRGEIDRLERELAHAPAQASEPAVRALRADVSFLNKDIDALEQERDEVKATVARLTMDCEVLAGSVKILHTNVADLSVEASGASRGATEPISPGIGSRSPSPAVGAGARPGDADSDSESEPGDFLVIEEPSGDSANSPLAAAAAAAAGEAGAVGRGGGSPMPDDGLTLRSTEALKRDRRYRKHFSLPDDEILLETYSCMNSHLLPGLLYVSKNFVCFDTHVFPRGGSMVKLPVREIADAAKVKSVLVFDTAISLEMVGGIRYTFTGFIHRDVAFLEISRVAAAFNIRFSKKSRGWFG